MYLGTIGLCSTQSYPLRTDAYIRNLAMGIMLIIQTSHPFGSLWANGTINFALPYFVLSVSMTVIATGIMIARLLVARGRLQRLLGLQTPSAHQHVHLPTPPIGSSDNSEPYIGVAAMLVESCALYSTFSLIFIILFAVNNPIQYVFLSALANVQVSMNPVNVQSD